MNVEKSMPGVAELAWFKSSYSSGEGGECVEVAADGAAVHVRDTKGRDRAMVDVAPGAWTAFVGFAARG
ncbi:DUF397 domain-containing protein [Streptomyces endophyticus]|uniref:DUF397 domain-containing protein n=1 Tax=Streptomyces endophyticus TaxID=714166 RepID=A0ABU6F5X9_9ACTN|nr:DUF397 domain-containing protein [Streptomyces endophyticus]MEB8339429.1 DUF397 domain-containing protein [Streptomyces endophyticus]